MALSKSEQQELDQLNFIYKYPSLRNKIDVLVSYALDTKEYVFCDSDYIDQVINLKHYTHQQLEHLNTLALLQGYIGSYDDGSEEAW